MRPSLNNTNEGRKERKKDTTCKPRTGDFYRLLTFERHLKCGKRRGFEIFGKNNDIFYE